jgi:signal transduction histidine kinase
MARKESSMLEPSWLEMPMQNEGALHQRSAPPDRADNWPELFRDISEAINQAATLEELFRRVAEAVRLMWPDRIMSLAMRTADAKFVRTKFVACQNQIFSLTAQMPFRRFCRAVKLPDGRRYLERVPDKLWPLLFPNLAVATPLNDLPAPARDNQTFNLNLPLHDFTPPKLLRENPSLEKRQNDANGAASQRQNEIGLLAKPQYASAFLVPLRDLSALAGDASRSLNSPDIQNGKAKPETMLGCIAIVSRRENAFSPNDGDWLVALADLLAAGIHKVQLLQERKHALYSFQQFVSASNEMGTATDLITALQKIVQAAAHTLRIPAASAAVFELTTVGDVEQSSLSHFDEKAGAAAKESSILPPAMALADWPRFPLRSTRGIVKRLLRNQPLVVYDVAKSRIFSKDAKELLAQHQIRSYFGLPIFLDPPAGQSANTYTTPMALLNLYAHAPHEIDELDTAMLRAFAAHAAQVLAKVRLNQQLKNDKAHFDGLRRSAMEDLENFVYVISHNLKTPVASIQGFANILQEEVGPALEMEHQHFLERIQKNAATMEKMVLALLEFSRVGRATIKLERVDINALVRSVIDEMCWRGQDSEVEFVFPRQAEEPPSLLADVAELKIVFDNLISNAVKYRRPEALLRIEIGWEEQPRFYVFWVRDNGMGMDPAFQAKAFDLFQRAPNVGQIFGTGVGLAIVRRIVENHQGLVRLHSKLGEGTTVYFTLPKIDAPPNGEQAGIALTH